MKLHLQLILPAVICLGFIASETALAQLSFTNSNNRLSTTTRSGCAVTVVDVNNDGLDDIVRMDDGHLINLELQNRDGMFTNYFIADIAGGSAWAMTMADVDHNGWKDVVADGNGGIWLVKIFENGGTISSTNSLLANSVFFLQNATFCDFNNDGWIDLFCCDDNDVSKMYLNDGMGNLNPSNMVDFAVNPGITFGNDPADSGNYGSTWIDFDNDNDLDLYIAHCRQGVNNPSDLRRINRLFVNDGNNNFTEMADQYGIAIGWQSWTSSFGDIDNDGDLDLLLTNHDYTNQIFENDGTGHFTELTTTGIGNFNITPIESVFEDFDNDGYLDILIAGSEWLYFKNNGNKTFTRVTGLLANNGMLSFATGDLNHDGFVDIFASYGDLFQNPSSIFDDVLYLNNRNNNNFITFNLEGVQSNAGAIGARVTIYGPWGIQIREVRAGESYGTCNSSQLHFGIGQNTAVDSAVVWFPSGTTSTLTNLFANQFVTIVENGCQITGNIIPGPFILCTGQSMNLNATPGFVSYNWTDGSTTQSINVSAAGLFNVLVTDNAGCTNISPTITVQLNPDETPAVTTSNDLIFCEGQSTVLTSSPAFAYLWSDGSTNQSLIVTQTGSYVVTIQGTCSIFTSATTDIEVLDAPEPVGQGASSIGPVSVQLSATGNNLSWYDQQTGGSLLGTGPTFNTPVINTTTTYWVDATTDYIGAIDFAGQEFHMGSLFSGSPVTNGSVDFDVTSPCVLVSVKVYTDIPGNREIELRNSSGDVLQSLLVNIPIDSSRITLNFNLVPGTYYSLTTNPIINNQTLGYSTPRLQRSSQNVLYPYSIPNLLSIVGSNQGSQYYYYFYDWEVQEPSYVCVSDRVPVVADITTGLNDVNGLNAISIYPNPASYLVTIETNSTGKTAVELVDVTGRIVRASSYELTQPGKLTFDLNGIASGSYMIRIRTTNGEVTRRLSVN
ncbi:MAG: FG-GAP-like repeat-containing protein [Bacteroidota bacterium]|nr:FG-GAP-like repeat-containing protein [Bacteroidota bacterium]